MPPLLLVCAPAAAIETAVETLRQSPLLDGCRLGACAFEDLSEVLVRDAPIAAVLLCSDDPTVLHERIACVHEVKSQSLVSIVARCSTPVAPETLSRLWALGVSDLLVDQTLDDPALAASMAAALREYQRQQAFCAITEASTRLANARSLGSQARLALSILGEQGFGRRGAVFCFERTGAGRELLAIAGTGTFASVDCTPVEDLEDRRAGDVLRQALDGGRSLFAPDLAVLSAGTDVRAHRALIALALDTPLLPWERRLLDAFAHAIGPAIADRQLSQQLARAQHAMIATLARLAEYKDIETGEHVARVARITSEIASHLAQAGTFPEADAFLVEQIGHASVLHDVGKVAIPESVLLKPGALNADERRIINDHVVIGHDILREAAALASHGESSLFNLASEIARHHHERFDGSGYPDGLQGEDIPLSARIVAVVDVFDALVSRRPYKEAWPIERALAVIREESGRHFDPRVVEAFLTVQARKSAARFIAWSDDMSVGRAELDRDHQRLIGILNHLGVNMELGNRNIVEFILDDLADYAKVHFEREEAYLESIGFQDLPRHSAIHASITQRIEAAKWKYFQGISETLQSELLVFLTTWLNNHILIEDMRYKAAAAQSGT